MSTSAHAVLAILMICDAVSSRYNYLPFIKKTYVEDSRGAGAQA